jgi:transcriptional antiterminator NusG
MEVDSTKGQWYVLHTLSGKENKVKETLDNQIRLAEESIPVYEVLVPIEKVTEIKNGKKSVIRRKIFPGYVYVRTDLYQENGDLNDGAWFFIRGVQGVISFVGGSERPIPLSPAEVEDLLRSSDNAADKDVTETKVPSFVSIGATVRIIDGAFANFEGVIEEIDVEHGKLKLMVSIFGRSTPVELEFWQVGPDEE